MRDLSTLDLSALIEESKRTGIYDRFVADDEATLEARNPALLVSIIKSLLTLQQQDLLFRSDIIEAIQTAKPRGLETQVTLSFAHLLDHHQPVNTENIALIAHSRVPLEAAEVIVQLTNGELPNFIRMCLTLSEPAFIAKTILRLQQNHLLSDKIVQAICTHSQQEDSFIRLVSTGLDTEWLDAKKLDRLASTPSSYLGSVRWSLIHIQNFIFNHDAPHVMNWFFPMRSLKSIPADFITSFWTVPYATRTEAEIDRATSILCTLRSTTLSHTYLFNPKYPWLLSSEAKEVLWDHFPSEGTPHYRDQFIAGLLSLLDISERPDYTQLQVLFDQYYADERNSRAARASLPTTYSQGTYADRIEASNYTRPIPDKFICPITRGIITDPMTDDGKTFYEKSALEYQIAHTHKNPLTNAITTIAQFQTPATLAAAAVLKEEIDTFMLEEEAAQKKSEPPPCIPKM